MVRAGHSRVGAEWSTPGGCGAPGWERVAIQGGQEGLAEGTLDQRTEGEGREA